jgi:Fe-S cluster biosynthesis and repair protein YggX
MQAWNTDMEKATLIKEESLNDVTEDVRSFVTEVNPKFLTTLKYKFNKPDYKEVASLPFDF